MNKYKHIIYIVIIIFLLFAWASSDSRQTTEFVEVPVPGPVQRMDTERRECQPVVIIKKDQVLDEYSLPDAIAQDDAMEVTAAGEIAPYAGVTLATAVYNSVSGTTKLYSRQEPIPFIGFPNDFALGFRYGLTETAFEVYADWQPLRVGKWYAGLYAEGNDEGEFMALATGERRF